MRLKGSARAIDLAAASGRTGTRGGRCNINDFNNHYNHILIINNYIFTFIINKCINDGYYYY